MSLRSLLIAITIAAVVAMSVAVYVESSFVLGLGFAKVERVQNAAVARLSQAVLSSEILALEDFSASVERDTSLARSLLTARSAMPHSVKSWISSGHCVASDIIPLDRTEGLFGWPVGADSGVVVRALRGARAFSLRDVAGSSQLVAYFPIRLFRDAVAVGVCSRDVDAAIAKTIGQSDLKVRFSVQPPVGDRVEIADARIAGTGWIRVLSNTASNARFESLGRLVLLAFAATLLLTVLILTAVNRYFLTAFRSVMEQFKALSIGIEAGEVAQTTAKIYPIQELTFLSQAAADLSLSIITYSKRVSEKSRAEALGEKAAQLAHDVKGPLAVLNMALETGEDSKSEKADLLRQTVHRIRTIVADVSVPAAPTAVVKQVSNGLSNVSELVRSVVTEKAMEYKKSRLIVSASSDCCLAYVDAAELQRAVSNVVDNAVHANGGGGQIVVEITELGPEVLVRVMDHGGGFAPSTIRYLGERGVSFGKSGGQGLGLWQAKQMVLAAGGRIVFENGVSGGAVVTLGLPRTELKEGKG
jgi:signal transduction histidine kinase